jgi:hypothetical protein
MKPLGIYRESFKNNSGLKKENRRDNLVRCSVCGDTWISVGTPDQICSWCKAKQMLLYNEKPRKKTYCKKCSKSVVKTDLENGLCKDCRAEKAQIDKLINTYGGSIQNEN